MARAIRTAATLMGTLIVFGATPVFACDTQGKSATASAPKKAADSKARKQGGDVDLYDSVENALAEKCTCEGKSDCTCKKGSCKCKKCGGTRRLIDGLNGSKDVLKIPDTARYDATAGILI
jgi:hypothetical protein